MAAILVRTICLGVLALMNVSCNGQDSSTPPAAAATTQPVDLSGLSVATFGGGCFWCMQPPYDQLPGVAATTVGYTGGRTENPTYEQVCSGTTGHAEAVQIYYDPDQVTYDQLLDVFWRNIDPTTLNQQFADYGNQYRTAIFYHTDEQKRAALESKAKLEQSGRFDRPIATEITPASTFYPAEENHQKYYVKCPLRYQSYKKGSGRQDYLRQTWGEESH